MHSHLREPGQTHKEDVLSGTRSAAAGGFTRVLLHAQHDRRRWTIQKPQLIIISARPQKCCKGKPGSLYHPGACEGRAVADFSALSKAGAVAFSDDGVPVADSGVMREAMMAAKKTGARLLLHEEDMSLRGGGSANEGENAKEAGIQGIPASTEETMTARDIILAEEIGCPLHICHVSTKGSVRMIREAKRRGVLVTCETAPHYFSLDDSAVRTGNPNAKVNPPLRSEADVRAIRQGIVDGTIDAIATDHAPHTNEDKSGGFARAAFGLIGFETAYSLGMMNLVHAGLITERRLETLMSTQPRKILALGGGLQEGEPADITICDPEKTYTYDLDSVVSKSKNSPFLGKRMTGCVIYTVVDGRIIYDRYTD